MESLKERYLDYIEDLAAIINSLTLVFSFIGIIATGIIALVLHISIPLIIASSVFGVSLVDMGLGALTDFKGGDITYCTGYSIGEINHHGVKSHETVPPLLYGLLAIPSVFLSNKIKQEESKESYTSLPKNEGSNIKSLDNSNEIYNSIDDKTNDKSDEQIEL